jgi:nicotinamidase-related amidase
VIKGKEEVLWPVHCVQKSKGSELSQLLKLNGNEIYVKKGIVLDE